MITKNRMFLVYFFKTNLEHVEYRTELIDDRLLFTEQQSWCKHEIQFCYKAVINFRPE